MKTITIIILLCLITQVLQTNGLIQLKNSLATSDSPLLMKILQLVDAATSDEHLLQVTLKLLRSLCICMRETLKAKEDYFNIGNHSLEPAEPSGNDGKVYDLYRNIYNNTCFNIRQELTNRTHKFIVEEETAFLNHTNCGKDERNESYNKRNNSDHSSAVKHSIPSRLEQVLFKALIQTKDLHEYRLRRYDLFGKGKPQRKSTLRHCLIVILTLYPNDQEISSKKHDIDEKDLNNTLYTKSPIDVDIIDTKHDQKRKENGEPIRAEKFSECNLRSLYNFLTESDRKKLIKVYKFIRKRDTFKIYMEVNVGKNHTDIINNCCENGTVIPQCNKDLINDFITQPNFLDDIYTNTITNIKSLVKQYETKLNDTKHHNISATTVQGAKKEEKIVVESTTKPSTHANEINIKENDMHVLVTKSNESSKLGDVTHAIVLLNDFVSKQNTKSYLKTHQTDKTDSDKPWTDFVLKEERQQEVTTTCNPINISTALKKEQKSQNESTSSLLLCNKVANTEKYVLENIVGTTTTFKQHETTKEKNKIQGVTLQSSQEKRGVKKELQQSSTSRTGIENVVINTFTIDSSSTNNDVKTELYTIDMQNTTIANRVNITVIPIPHDNDKLTEFTSSQLNTNKTFIPDSRITQNAENKIETYLVEQHKTKVSDIKSATTASTVQSTKTTLHYSLRPVMVSFTNSTTLSTDLGTKAKEIPEEYFVTDHSTIQNTIPVKDLKRAKKKSKYKTTDNVTTLSTRIPMFDGHQTLSNVQSIPEMLIPIKSTGVTRFIAKIKKRKKTTKPFASEEGNAGSGNAVLNEVTTKKYKKVPKYVKKIDHNLFFDVSTLHNVLKETETITFTSESPETKIFSETTMKAKLQNITTNTTLKSLTTLSTLNFTKLHNQSVHDDKEGINAIDRVTSGELMSTVASHVTVMEPYDHTVQKIRTNVTINGLTEISPIETTLTQSNQDLSKASKECHSDIFDDFIGEAKPHYNRTNAGTENNKKTYMTTSLSVTTEENKVTAQETVSTFLQNVPDNIITMTVEKPDEHTVQKIRTNVTINGITEIPPIETTLIQPTQVVSKAYNDSDSDISHDFIDEAKPYYNHTNASTENNKKNYMTTGLSVTAEENKVTAQDTVSTYLRNVSDDEITIRIIDAVTSKVELEMTGFSKKMPKNKMTTLQNIIPSKNFTSTESMKPSTYSPNPLTNTDILNNRSTQFFHTAISTEPYTETEREAYTTTTSHSATISFSEFNTTSEDIQSTEGFENVISESAYKQTDSDTTETRFVDNEYGLEKYTEMLEIQQSAKTNTLSKSLVIKTNESIVSEPSNINENIHLEIKTQFTSILKKVNKSEPSENLEVTILTSEIPITHHESETEVTQAVDATSQITTTSEMEKISDKPSTNKLKGPKNDVKSLPREESVVNKLLDKDVSYTSPEETFTLKNNISLINNTDTDSFQKVDTNVSKTLSRQNVSSTVESPSSHGSTPTEITPSELLKFTREHITINANISADDFLAKHNSTFVHKILSTTPESGTKRPTTISAENTFINALHSSNYFTTEISKKVDKEATTKGIIVRNKNQADEYLTMPTSTMAMGSLLESITPSEPLEFTREHIRINANISADDFLAKYNSRFVHKTLSTTPESGTKRPTTINTDNTFISAFHSSNYFITEISKTVDKEATTMGIIVRNKNQTDEYNHATLKTKNTKKVTVPRAKKKHRENLTAIADDIVTEKIMSSLTHTETTTRNELRHDEMYYFRNNGTNLTQGKIRNISSTENIDLNDVKEATNSLYTKKDSYENIQDELMPGLKATPIMTTTHKTFNANNWSYPHIITYSENKEDSITTISGPEFIELTNNADVERFKDSSLFTPETVFSALRVSTAATLNLTDVMQNTTTNKQDSFLISDMETTQFSFIKTFQTTQVDARNNATITGPIFGSNEVTITEDLGERSTTSQVTDFVSKQFNKSDQLFEKETDSSIDQTTSELVQMQFHLDESKITPAYDITKSIINAANVNGSTESSFYKPHRMQTTFVNKHFTSYVTESSTLTKAIKNYTENSNAKRPKSSKRKIKLKSPIAFELNIRVGVEANKDGIKFSVLDEKERVYNKSELRLPITTYFNSNRSGDNNILETLTKSEKIFVNETQINNTASLNDHITNALLKNMNTNRRSNYLTKEDLTRIAVIMQKLKKKPRVVNKKIPQRTKTRKTLVRNTTVNEEIQPHQTNTTSFNASQTSIHTNFTNIKHKSKVPGSLTEESLAINHIQSIYKEHIEKIQESMNNTKKGNISATDVLKKFYQAIITLPVAGNINNSRLNMSGINGTSHKDENQEDLKASLETYFRARTNLVKSKPRLNKNKTNKTSTLIKNKIDKLLKNILKGKNLSKSQMRTLKRNLLKNLTSKKNVISVHKFNDTVKNKYYFNMTTDSDKLTTTTPYLPLSYNLTTIEDGNATRIQKVETLTSSSPISKTPNKKMKSFENNKILSNEKMAKGINKQISAEIIFNTTGTHISQGSRRLLTHQIELESSKFKPETIYQYTSTEANIGFNEYVTAITPLTTEVPQLSGIILSEMDEDLSKPENESNNNISVTPNVVILNSSDVITKTEVTKGTQSTFDELNDFIEELNGVSSQKSDNITSSYVDVISTTKITNKGKSNYNMSTIVTDAGNTTAVTNTISKTAATKYGIMTAPFQTTVAIYATDTPLLITEFENVPNKFTSVNENSKHTVAMTTVKSNTFDKSEFQPNDNVAVVEFPLMSNTITITKVLPRLNKPNDNITQTIHNVTTKIHDMKYYKRLESNINISSASAVRNNSEEIILSSPPDFDVLTTYYPEVQSSSTNTYNIHKPTGTVFTGMLNKQTVTEKSLDRKSSQDINYGNLSENSFNYFTGTVHKYFMNSSTTDYISTSAPNNEQLKPTPHMFSHMFYGLSTLLPEVESLRNTKNVSADNFPTTVNILEHKTDSDVSTSILIKEIYKRKQNGKKYVSKEITNKVNDHFQITKTSTATYPSNISMNIREEIITTQHPIEEYLINTADEGNTLNMEEYEEEKTTEIPAISKTEPPFIQIPTKILLTEKKHEGNKLEHEIQIINALNYNKTTTTKNTEEQHLSTNTPNLTEKKNIENFNDQKKEQYLQTSQNINKEHLLSEKIFGDGNYISTGTVKLPTISVANIKTSEITLPPQFSKVLGKPFTETHNLPIPTYIPDAFMETTIEKQNDSKTEPTFTIIDRYNNPTDIVVTRNVKDNTNLIKLKVDIVKNETYINFHNDIKHNSYSLLQKKVSNAMHENETKNDKSLDIDRFKFTSVNTAATTVTTLTFKDYEIANQKQQSNEIFTENFTQSSNSAYDETTLLLHKYKNVDGTTRSNILQGSTDLPLVSKFVNTSAMIPKIYLLDHYTRQIVANQSIENKVTENNNIISQNSPIATQDIITVTDFVNQVTKVSSGASTRGENTSLSEIRAYDKLLETKLKISNKTQLLYFVDKSVNVSGTTIRNIINANKNNAYDQRDPVVSIKQNKSKKLQETSRNNRKQNFFLNVHDGEKNISVIRTPTLTHVKVTKMNPVNKTTVNLKPEVQKLLLISRTDRTYQNGTMGKGFRSNSKSLLPIESRDFKRKKTIEIFSSRLNRPYSSFTTTTAVTKSIRYNTYRPISKEELELLKHYKEYVSNTALDKQVIEKPHPPVPGFNYSSNARRSSVSSLQPESKPILRVANYSEAGQIINAENQGHGDKGSHLALEKKKELNQPIERIKIPHSAEIDRISHPILEININSPQIRTNGDSPPMIEINGNPLPIEINRNSEPMELNRNPLLMNSNRNPVPTGINRYSVPIEINRNPVPMGNNRNPVQMDINRNSAPMDVNRSPVPMDMNRNSARIEMNRNPVPMDINRNSVPMDMNRNSAPMDMNRNLVPMDANRYSAPMDMNRNLMPMKMNRNSAPMDMNRNLVPMDVNRYSAPVDMNRNSAPMDVNRNAVPLDMNRNSVPMDINRNSAPMVMNRNPVSMDMNRNSARMNMNRNLVPMDINRNSAPIEINRNPVPINMNRNSAPMDMNRNPMPMDINRNSAPIEINRNLAPMDMNRNSVPIDINRNSAPIEINRNPVPMDIYRNPMPMDINRNSAPIEINRNLAPMDMNRNSVPMDIIRNSAPIEINRNPVTMDVNRNSSPIDMNRNPVPLDMNLNSTSMDMNINLVPMDINRNSAPIEINRNPVTMDVNRNSAPIEINRNPVPIDMKRNSAPMDMNRNPVLIDINRNLAPIEINRNPVPIDMNRNSTPMDMNRNPVPMDINRNLAPIEVNRNPVPIDMNRNSTPMDMNRNPVPMDINRNSAPIEINRNPVPMDMNRNPVPLDMNRNSAPMYMNRNPVPMDINRNSAPIDMKKNSAAMEINRNSVTMDINRNAVPININRDPVPIEIARNLIPQKNNRSYIPEETNRNSVPMKINKDSPRTFEINRNIPPTLNLNKNSPSVINPPSIFVKNKKLHKKADNNTYLLSDNKNSPSTIAKPWISASMFNSNGNLPPMIDNNSPSVHNSNRIPPAVIDINRYSFVVNKNSPSVVHNKWNLLSMIGNNYKNSPSIPDSNEKTSIGTDDKRNGPSITDSNKNSRSMDANMKTNKKSTLRNDNNQINNSTIKTKIISARNMAEIKKPEAIVAAKKKILPMKEIKRKPLLTFGNNKKPLSIIGKNRKTHGALEINRNKHSKIVTKNFKLIGSQKEILLDSFEKSNPYAVKMKEAKSQKPAMKQMKIGTGRKALMTMNTKDFLSQHRYVTPRSVVQKNTKPYPKSERSVRKSILRPRFDNINAAKKLEHKLKRKTVFINNEIFKTKSMSQRLSNKIHQKVRPGHNTKPGRLMTKKAKVNKKDIGDPMSYMFTADYMKMTRRPTFNDRLHVQKDSNIFKNNYSPSPSFRRSFIEKSSTEVGRTPRRGRTLFFLSPTAAYDQYN